MTVPGSVRSETATPLSHPSVTVGALGQAEVEDLDVAIRQDEHVVGFQVPMHDALLVRRGHALGDLQRIAQGLALGNRRGGELGAEGLPFQKLGYGVGDAALSSEVEDRQDVGVRERRDGQRLALEARDKFAVLGQAGRQNLDGDVAAKFLVVRPVDFTHAAHADPVQDPVGPDALACREYHRMTVVRTLSRGQARERSGAGNRDRTGDIQLGKKSRGFSSVSELF